MAEQSDLRTSLAYSTSSRFGHLSYAICAADGEAQFLCVPLDVDVLTGDAQQTIANLESLGKLGLSSLEDIGRTRAVISPSTASTSLNGIFFSFHAFPSVGSLKM